MPQSIPPNPDRLYELLPSLYRQADAANGCQLKALLHLIGNQVEQVRGDIQQLWNNYFIETCALWSVPYIGDLVANRTLYDIDLAQDATTATEIFTDLTGPMLTPVSSIRTRADVAKTIYYRRRKGTVPMLEELAGDVTGWGAHVVEFFQILTWAQNLNHLRLQSTGCVDLRSVSACARVGGPFDTASHNVDVRAISQAEGWYNVPNLGFFLWRLESMPLIEVRACAQPPASNTSNNTNNNTPPPNAWRYTFSPLGNSAPLFTRWPRTETEPGMSPELLVPGPITSPAFFDDLAAANAASDPIPSNYYGEVAEGTSNSLQVIEMFVGPGAVMPLGTNTLTTTQAGFFTQNDIGLKVEVPGAGAGGAALTTTVATFVNGQKVTLADYAGTDVTNGTFNIYRPVPATNITLQNIAGINAAILPGTNALSTTQTGFFAPSDVGLTIEVPGAGAGGTVLTTTVATFVDAEHVTLLNFAKTSVANGAFTIYRPVSTPNITCMYLSTWTTMPQPTGSVIGIDVESGRLAYCQGRAIPNAVYVSYNYGFSANIGGGPYPDRQKWLVPNSAADQVLTVDATQSLDDALKKWSNNAGVNTIINIENNHTHVITNTSWTLDPNKWLVIQADFGDFSYRPHIQPQGGVIQVTGSTSGSSLTLGGLLIEGRVNVSQDIKKLRLLHTTLVPGGSINEELAPPAKQQSIIIQSVDSKNNPINTDAQVQIAFSITGALQIPETVDSLWLLDSIVDGTGFQNAISNDNTVNNNKSNGPLATIERSTILGRSFFRKFDLCSETIFTDTVKVEDRVSGCLRFSYVSTTSTVPQQYRCQPALEINNEIAAVQDTLPPGQSVPAARQKSIRLAVQAWMVPSFESTVYGQPAYCQLSLRAPGQIRTGGADGAEMGAFNHLKQPQRESNLLIRLQEYVPFGRAPGIIYVT